MSATAFTELPEPPTDVVSSVRFSPDGNKLLVSAWDNAIRLYSRQGDQAFHLAKTIATRGSILDVCWAPDSATFWAVGVDHDVAQYNSEQGDESRLVLSSHGSGSSKVAYSKEHGILLSTAWDSTMHVHNPETKQYIRITLPEKPFGLAITADRAVVAMAERKVNVYELRALKELVEQAGGTADGQQALSVEPWQQRESSLKFMTRDLACMPDGTGFAVSSIDGRCGVEFFDPELEQQTFAFKCHREKIMLGFDDSEETQEVDVAFPVNALAFHPTHSCFATGGSERSIMLWDPQTKRRIRQYDKLDSSITSMDFSADGKYLAVGVSPLYDDGREEAAPSPDLIKIYVKELDGSETKTKPAKSKKAKAEKA